MRPIIVMGALLCAACSFDEERQHEQAVERVETVPIPTEWRLIPAGTISLRFPEHVDLRGPDDLCGGRSAPKTACSLSDEGPVYDYRGEGLTLNSRDAFGETGPLPRELGQLIQLNQIRAYEAKLGDGSVRYTVTAGSGGRQTASLL